MHRRMEACIENVVDMKRACDENERLVRISKDTIVDKEEKIVELMMALHNAEDEIVRMQCLLDCVAKAHPSVTEHFIKIQFDDFNFRDRKLEPFIALRRSDPSHAPRIQFIPYKVDLLQRLEWILQKSTLG